MSFDKLKKSNTQSNPIDPNKLAELEYTMRTSVGSLIGGLDVIAAWLSNGTLTQEEAANQLAKLWTQFRDSWFGDATIQNPTGNGNY